MLFGLWLLIGLALPEGSNQKRAEVKHSTSTSSRLRAQKIPSTRQPSPSLSQTLYTATSKQENACYICATSLKQATLTLNGVSSSYDHQRATFSFVIAAFYAVSSRGSALVSTSQTPRRCVSLAGLCGGEAEEEATGHPPTAC